MMRTVSIIIAREYFQRVRTKGFVISTIAIPVIMIALIVIPGAMGARSAMSDAEMGLVDRTGVLAEGLEQRLGSGGLRVEVADSPEAEDRMMERAESGELAGVLVVDAETLERGSATWIGEDPPSTLRRLTIQQAVSQEALTRRLGEGDDPALVALLAGGSLQVERVGAEEAVEDRLAGYAAGFVGAFFLYVVLLIYGGLVLRSVMEEKTGRIAEVILSSVRPWQLMLGKVVGVGAVGLTQLLIWVGVGALIIAFGVPAALPFLADAEVAAMIPDLLPGAGVLVFFLLSFLMGYFLYSSLFAAVGAMCSSEEEAQQLQLPVVMLVVIPFIFLFPVMDNPDGTFAVLMSLVPFFTPILMFGRVALGAAPLWEVLLSVVGMALAILLLAWVAGRIYRVGILMQGKRPTLPELWRWVREA
jgi:ABC-2 type transport system permease protein